MTDEMKDEKRYQARNMACKKVISENVDIEKITYDLYEICEYCNDFDRNVLIDVFGGDEETASQYEILACDISCEGEKLMEMLEEYKISDDFDDFFVAVRPEKSEDKLLGYDDEVYDYYELDSYESRFFSTKYKNRLMKKKKEEIVERVGICLDLLFKYIDLADSYAKFKAAMDILINENNEYILVISKIEKAYEEAEKDNFDEWSESTKHFDSLIQKLPEEIWATS